MAITSVTNIPNQTFSVQHNFPSVIQTIAFCLVAHAFSSKPTLQK